MRAKKNNDDWVEVLFSTLTYPNEMGMRRCLKLGSGFYDAVSKHTKCHLRVARGKETSAENKHEHSITLVKKGELELFNKRFESFDATRAFEFHQLVERFDMARKVEGWQYALVKHTPASRDEAREYYCPQRYHQCRRGKCKHIPAT